MNPHRQAWGFAYDMPFAQIVAITLMVALVINPQKLRLPWNGTIAIWILFLLWMGLTTAVALHPAWAMVQFTNVVKIQVVTFLTLLLINTQERIQQLIWVIVVSIGFYSVKGGIFTLMTGGAFRVYGPAGSNISENNALALATLIVVPLMVYLYQIHKANKWMRYGLGVSIFFSVISAIGSQSRGALIALLAVGMFFWWRSQSKLVTGIGAVLLAGIIVVVMPESWKERMNSITNYEEDASAMGRIHAWQYSMAIASDRITGGGFNSWSADTYAIYAPQSKLRVVAHSIYFSVIADHGWPGFVLFASILFLTWRRLSRLHRAGDPPDDPFRPALLARMLQVSMVAYLSGGLFLSLSYFDLPWHIIAIAVLVSELYGDKKPAVTRGPQGYAVRS
jgi:probable O-glycosylation ligase (exosortase A-associated)